MSFIAAVLILNLDTADAFIAFSNLLNKPCQMAFFRVDHGLVSMQENSNLHVVDMCRESLKTSFQNKSEFILKQCG